MRIRTLKREEHSSRHGRCEASIPASGSADASSDLCSAAAAAAAAAPMSLLLCCSSVANQVVVVVAPPHAALKANQPSEPVR